MKRKKPDPHWDCPDCNATGRDRDECPECMFGDGSRGPCSCTTGAEDCERCSGTGYLDSDPDIADAEAETDEANSR